MNKKVLCCFIFLSLPVSFAWASDSSILNAFVSNPNAYTNTCKSDVGFLDSAIANNTCSGVFTNLQDVSTCARVLTIQDALCHYKALAAKTSDRSSFQMRAPNPTYDTMNADNRAAQSHTAPSKKTTFNWF